eukprot:364648-Chlamydomonas_euryale.AAC.12
MNGAHERAVASAAALVVRAKVAMMCSVLSAARWMAPGAVAYAARCGGSDVGNCYLEVGMYGRLRSVA